MASWADEITAEEMTNPIGGTNLVTWLMKLLL